MSDLIERMKEAAQKATPGPYVATTCADYWLEANGKGIALFGEMTWLNAAKTINDQSEMEANARFHALCSPDNILSLIDRLTASEAAREKCEAALREVKETYSYSRGQRLPIIAQIDEIVSAALRKENEDAT